MSMGEEAMEQSEEEEQKNEFDSPARDDKLELGTDSYADDDLFARNGKGGKGGKDANELYRMEENKTAWEASMDADIANAATHLAAQMQSNPEDGNQVALHQHQTDDLAQLTDPLGLGVLNQATLQLERNAESLGTTRRQLQKLARWQAGATANIGHGDGVAQPVLFRLCRVVVDGTPYVARSAYSLDVASN
jgi:hypothetical protein